MLLFIQNTFYCNENLQNEIYTNSEYSLSLKFKSTASFQKDKCINDHSFES